MKLLLDGETKSKRRRSSGCYAPVSDKDRAQAAKAINKTIFSILSLLIAPSNIISPKFFYFELHYFAFAIAGWRNKKQKKVIRLLRTGL